jgi:hypothetical protein
VSASCIAFSAFDRSTTYEHCTLPTMVAAFALIATCGQHTFSASVSSTRSSLLLQLSQVNSDSPVAHRQSLLQLPRHASTGTSCTTTPGSSTVLKPTPPCTSRKTTKHSDLRNVNVARKPISSVTPSQHAKLNRGNTVATRPPMRALGNRTVAQRNTVLASQPALLNPLMSPFKSFQTSSQLLFRTQQPRPLASQLTKSAPLTTLILMLLRLQAPSIWWLRS